MLTLDVFAELMGTHSRPNLEFGIEKNIEKKKTLKLIVCGG